MDNNSINNDKLNNILAQLLQQMYMEFGDDSMSNAFETTLKFDGNQKITSIDNYKVDGQLKMPSKEIVEKLNKTAQQLIELPEIFRLKECFFKVGVGGAMNIVPVYIS